MKTAMHLTAALALVLFARVDEAAAQIISEEHVAIVIDRSGSMQSRRSSDNRTRFEEAIRQAKQIVNMPSNRTRYISIWTFEGTSFIQAQGFSTDPVVLNTTLDGLTVGSGVTPLAGTVCDVSDALMSYPGTDPDAQKTLKLVSDGEENSTPSTNQCYGPSSATVWPNLATGSWQWKVRNKLKTGDANDEGSGNYRIVMDVTVLYGYISLTGNDAIYEEDGKDARSTGGVSATLSSSYFEFLQGVATASGGTITAIDDSAPAPVVGDATGDYCVDDADYYLVLANYGYTVPPADPAADLNKDLIVDYYDYSIVLDNWGQGGGCGTATISAQ